MYERLIAGLAGGQYNRVSWRQLLDLGVGERAVRRRLADGRLVAVEDGVFAVAPVREDDDWGNWMGATLTAPNTFLCRFSAAAALGAWGLKRSFETVVRPGNGGPRRHGGVVAFRSLTLEGETTTYRGVPITTPSRTLLDIAASRTSQRALARTLREMVRLERVTIPELTDALAGWRRRRGAGRLTRTAVRYSGLPIERARSGAEVRAMEIIRDADRPLPESNKKIAGEEADLIWREERLIVEIDGAPFHLDAGEDARKQACWEDAGWQVERLPSEDVYEQPHRLLALAP